MRDTKIKTIFNMKLAGILMQHGFVLLDMRPNENQNGKTYSILMNHQSLKKS